MPSSLYITKMATVDRQRKRDKLIKKYLKVVSVLIPVFTCSACKNESNAGQFLGLMPEQDEYVS